MGQSNEGCDDVIDTDIISDIVQMDEIEEQLIQIAEQLQRDDENDNQQNEIDQLIPSEENPIQILLELEQLTAAQKRKLPQAYTQR